MYLAVLPSGGCVATRESKITAVRDLSLPKGFRAGPIWSTVISAACFSGIKVLQSVKAMNACRIPV